MSDPVTNIEIEDVLSSIRRLVSDEARASERGEKELSFSSDEPPQAVEIEDQSAADPAESMPEPEKTVAPALVLTPELRIVSDTDVETEAVALCEIATEKDKNVDETALILTPSDAVPSNEQLFADPEHIGLSEAAADGSDEQTDPVLESAPEASHVEDEAGQVDAEAGTAEATSDQPVTIEDKIAALEALISRSDNDFEPDGVEVGGNAARQGQTLPWEDSAEQRSGLQMGDLPDPESASQDASFNEESVAFQQAHSEAVDAALAEIEANTAETLLETDDIGAVIDEETLRDMVSEIVRQELQGPLGERITRNVRKLVRREIYRAIAANELD